LAYKKLELQLERSRNSPAKRVPSFFQPGIPRAAASNRSDGENCGWFSQQVGHKTNEQKAALTGKFPGWARFPGLEPGHDQQTAKKKKTDQDGTADRDSTPMWWGTGPRISGECGKRESLG